MKELLSEEEKKYITEKIIDPMKVDIGKALLFQTVQRASIMLESALNKVKFDRKLYDARISIVPHSTKEILIRVESKKRDCEEVVSYTVPVTLP